MNVLSRIEQDRFFTRDLSQLADRIIDIAITFERIRMNVFTDSKEPVTYDIEGVWSGKTTNHWTNNIIQVSSSQF